MEKLFDKLPHDILGRMKSWQLVLIGLVVAGGIFLAYWVLPHASYEEDYAAQEKRKADLEGTLKRYQSEIVQEPILMRKVATLQADLEEHKRQLPHENELPGLLSRVTNIGGMLGIQVTKFEVGSDISKEHFYRQVPMTVQIAGGFYNTLGFFDWLQNLLQVVEIGDMTMETKPVKQTYINDKGELDFEFVKMVETTIKAKVYAFVDSDTKS